MDRTSKSERKAALEQFKIIADNLHEYAFFDTETTGLLDDPQSEVWQIGLVTFNRRGTLLKHSWYLRPKHRLPSIITELTGVESDDLRLMPTFTNIYPVFDRLTNDKTLVAYNSHFDIEMMLKTCEIYGIEPSMFEHRDIMRLYASFKQFRWNDKHGHWSWCKLSEENFKGIPSAISQEGLNLGDAHTAIDDVMATIELVKKVATYDE